MRWLVLLALAGCIEAPATGRIWSCTATFVCDGVEYGQATGGACVDDDDEPEEAFRAAVEAKDWGYQCAEWSLQGTVCTTSPFAICTP